MLVKQIAFVIPYIGQWPSWGQLFFLSVKHNPTIDVLVVCEEVPPYPVPENVLIIQVSREDLLSRLNSATGLALQSITGHKLCDFRPFFGLAFADLLEKYEFWGFCDIDMMFGDLAKLLNPEFLAAIDVFSAHDKEIVGHFTLLRNSSTVNNVCFDIAEWKERLSRVANTSLDEIPFGAALKAKAGLRWASPRSLPDELTEAFCRFGVTFGFDGSVADLPFGGPFLGEWRNGATYLHSQSGAESEVLYLHFMGTKRSWHWLFFDDKSVAANVHRFSRIGYGGVAHVGDLRLLRWRFFYLVQQTLQDFKRTGGNSARKLLPERYFLALRRRIFGRSRY